jgi:hypothetical protein
MCAYLVCMQGCGSSRDSFETEARCVGNDLLICEASTLNRDENERVVCLLSHQPRTCRFKKAVLQARVMYNFPATERVT